MAQLELAVSLCTSGECHGMVTAPVHKAVINEAGMPFSGHTEFLAEATGTEKVMLLATGALKVALATTHLPLREVPNALSADDLEKTFRTLHTNLLTTFKISRLTVVVRASTSRG